MAGPLEAGGDLLELRLGVVACPYAPKAEEHNTVFWLLVELFQALVPFCGLAVPGDQWPAFLLILFIVKKLFCLWRLL